MLGGSGQRSANSRWSGNARPSILGALAIAAVVLLPFPFSEAAARGVRVGIVIDGPVTRADLIEIFRHELIDLVIALGLIASQEAGRRGHLPKPTFAPFPVDVAMLGLPYADGVSGVRNFNYLAANIDTRQSLEAFRDLVPFQHLALLVNAELARAVDTADASQHVWDQHGDEQTPERSGHDIAPFVFHRPTGVQLLAATCRPGAKCLVESQCTRAR